MIVVEPKHTDKLKVVGWTFCHILSSLNAHCEKKAYMYKWLYRNFTFFCQILYNAHVWSLHGCVFVDTLYQCYELNRSLWHHPAFNGYLLTVRFSLKCIISWHLMTFKPANYKRFTYSENSDALDIKCVLVLC